MFGASERRPRCTARGGGGHTEYRMPQMLLHGDHDRLAILQAAFQVLGFKYSHSMCVVLQSTIGSISLTLIAAFSTGRVIHEYME